LMKWPREPTVEEALAYAAHDEACVAALVYWALEDFRKKPPPPVMAQPDRSLFVKTGTSRP
jgi:hypothetical protein